MVPMAFCDLLLTFQKQVTNVSQHFLVILHWEMLMSTSILFDLLYFELLNMVRFSNGLDKKMSFYMQELKQISKKFLPRLRIKLKVHELTYIVFN